ncbi:hypothetical protein ACHAXS_013321 [Conticribra weissflogii]
MFTSTPNGANDELDQLVPDIYDSGDDDATEEMSQRSVSFPNFTGVSTATAIAGTTRMEGWLHHTNSGSNSHLLSKTVSKKKHRSKKQPRYFVLRGGTLSYYSRMHDVKAKGTFVLTRGCTVSQVTYTSFDLLLKSLGLESSATNPVVEKPNLSRDTSIGAESLHDEANMDSKSNKNRKKKQQFYCIQITWPTHDKPSKNEKYMAQAKAQVAAESENEALQQQQQQEQIVGANSDGKVQVNTKIPKSISARNTSTSSSHRANSIHPSPKSSPIRSLKSSVKSTSVPLDISLPLENELDTCKGTITPTHQSQLKPSTSSATLATSNAKKDQSALLTPAYALSGTRSFNSKSSDVQTGQHSSSYHAHETGLHKHYTQQIEKHAKDQQKTQEELNKVMLLLSKKESHQKFKKKMLQGTKVAAVSTAAITAGVLTAGIGLAAGLVFVGITAAAGGSGAVVGSKVYDKAKGKYYQMESQRSFHLILGADSHEEAMRWKAAIEHAIQELVLASKEEDGDELDVESITQFVEKEKGKWRVVDEGHSAIDSVVSDSGGRVLLSPKRIALSPTNLNDHSIMLSPANRTSPYVEPSTTWVPIQGGGIAMWGILGALGGGGNLRIYREEHANHHSLLFGNNHTTPAFPKMPKFRSAVGLEGQPFSPFKASVVLKAKSLDAFMCLMCSGRISNFSANLSASIPIPNSGQIASFRIIETMNDHLDVIHLIFRPLYLFPSWTAPRDFVLDRFWKFDDDGTYQIYFDSRQHRDCPPVPGYVRGEMHSVYTIAPLKRKKRRSGASTVGSGTGLRFNANDECLLSQVVQVDPRGWVPTNSCLPFFRNQGYGDAFAIMALHQMLDVREALDTLRFVAVPMDDTQHFGPLKREREPKRSNRLSRGTALKNRQSSGGERTNAGDSIYMPTLEVSESIDVSDDDEPDEHNYDFKYSSTELPHRDSYGDNAQSDVTLNYVNTEALPYAVSNHVDVSLTPRAISTHPSPTISDWWAEPDANSFRVRGKTYKHDKMKINAGPSLFRLIAVDIVETDVPIMTGMCLHPKERVQLALQRDKEAKLAGQSSDMPPFVFAVNIVLPGPPHYHMVFYYAVDDMSMIDGSDGTPSSKLCQQFFFTKDDNFRDNTFKLIPQIIEGNFMVRKAVGSTPAIMGNKIKQSYFQGERFFELMIDTGSSAVAAGVIRICNGYAKMIVVDLAFLFEGYDEQTLPERVLGCVRLKNVEFGKKLRFVEDA